MKKIFLCIATILLVTCFGKETEAVTVSQNHISNEGASNSSASDFEYEVENGTATITRYVGEAVNVTIPYKIDGYSVLRIAQETFQGNKEIETINFNRIPIEEIENSTFEGCTSLLSVCGFTNKLYRIGDYAFYGCESLETFDMWMFEISVIGEYAFYGCRSLKSRIESFFGFTEIGDYAFYGCENIAVFSQRNNMRFDIGEAAFAFCKNLTEVNAAGLKEISDYAFAGCPNLEKVLLSNAEAVGAYAFTGSFSGAAEQVLDVSSLAYIDDYAFFDSNIRALELPAVEKIGAHAFEGCDILQSVKMSDELINVGDYAFFTCPVMKKIIVPKRVEEIGDYAFGYVFPGEKNTNFTIEAQEGTEGFVYGVEHGFIDHKHVFVPEVIEEATCRSKGWKVMICEACWEEYEEEIPIKQHSFGAGKYIIEPTKKKGGKIEFTCKNCGQKVKQNLPVLKLERGDRFKKGKFSYRVVSEVDKTVRLLEYIGNGKRVTIPAKVTFNGVTYKIKYINCYSLKKNDTLETIFVKSKKIKKQIKNKVGKKKIIIKK